MPAIDIRELRPALIVGAAIGAMFGHAHIRSARCFGGDRRALGPGRHVQPERLRKRGVAADAGQIQRQIRSVKDGFLIIR